MLQMSLLKCLPGYSTQMVMMMVIVFAIIFVVVILKAWQSGVMYGRKEVKTSQKKSKRSVATQSQTTYNSNLANPRFHVLPEKSQGAFLQ